MNPSTRRSPPRATIDSRPGSNGATQRHTSQSAASNANFDANSALSYPQSRPGESPRRVVLTLDNNGIAQPTNYASEDILPFVQSQQSRPTEQGSFATVDQVELHPNGHRFHSIPSSIPSTNLFALKKLRTSGLTPQQLQHDFLTEVAMLNRFSYTDHAHLIKLLAAWTKPTPSGLEYCFLFPLASCDLDLYWIQRSITATTIPWIAKQILGLTDALRNIHDPPSNRGKPESERVYGRHGDLKPENILWFNSSTDAHGILVIADLGSCAVETGRNRSIVGNAELKHAPRYHPPEAYLEGGIISQAYDIWTFGCVLLEFVVWCLQGNEGREEFMMERFVPYPTGSRNDLFYEMKPARDGRYAVVVNEGVTKRIEMLHRDPRCTPFLHDLLYVIEEEMLVVVSATTNRITSAGLYDRFQRMNAKMERDPGYYQVPCGMPRPAARFQPVHGIFRMSVVR